MTPPNQAPHAGGADDPVRASVAQGIRDVLADDELMEGLLDRLIARLQRRAAERTGRWIWDSIRAVFSRWIVVGAIVLMVLKFGGVAAALQALRAMTSDGH